MDYIKLLRIPELLLIAIAQLIIHFCITTHLIGMNYAMPTVELALLVSSTVVIAAGGFVINSYYDMRIDEINHPLTRIVGNTISRHSVMNMYITLFVLGIILSVALGIITHSLNYCFIQITVIGLLWFYSSSYKRSLGGNFIVALTIALIPFIVAIYEAPCIMNWWIVELQNGWSHQLAEMGIDSGEAQLEQVTPYINQNYKFIGYISAIVFIFTYTLDIIRNLYEKNGEIEMESHTIPIVKGDQKAKTIIYVLLITTNLLIIAFISSHIEDMKMQSISYYICTTFAFSVGIAMFVKSASYPKDYKICLTLGKLLIFSVVAYGIIYAVLNPIEVYMAPV